MRYGGRNTRDAERREDMGCSWSSEGVDASDDAASGLRVLLAAPAPAATPSDSTSSPETHEPAEEADDFLEEDEKGNEDNDIAAAVTTTTADTAERDVVRYRPVVARVERVATEADTLDGFSTVRLPRGAACRKLTATLPLQLWPWTPVDVYKVVYACNSVSGHVLPVSVLLTLRLRVETAGVYESETGAVVNPRDGLQPATKYAVNEALLLDARFIGDTCGAVRKAEDGYRDGKVRLVSQWYLHQNTDVRRVTGLKYYEVGEVHREPRTGRAGANGCVQGIHAYGSEAAALTHALRACKTQPSGLSAVSKRVTDHEECVEHMRYFNTVRTPEDVFSPPPNDTPCIQCGSGFAHGAVRNKIFHCGHGPVCDGCADRHKRCPTCRIFAKRIGAFTCWQEAHSPSSPSSLSLPPSASPACRAVVGPV